MTMNQHRTYLVIFIAGIGLAAPGCGIFQSLIGGSSGPGTSTPTGDYAEAYRKGDEEMLTKDCKRSQDGRLMGRGKLYPACGYLKQMRLDRMAAAARKGDIGPAKLACSDKNFGDWLGGKPMNGKAPKGVPEMKIEPTGQIGHQACWISTRFRRAAASAALAKTFASCAPVPDVVKAFKDVGHKLDVLVPGLVKCKRADDIFTLVAKTGDPTEVLEAAHASGFDVAKAFYAKVSSLKSSKLINAFVDFALAQKVAVDCKQGLRSFKRVGGRVLAAAASYYRAGSCKKGIPQVKQLLASNNPRLRLHGCWVLGSLGEKRELPAVQRLADHDPEYKKVDLVRRQYWVREGCAAAANKIALR